MLTIEKNCKHLFDFFDLSFGVDSK